MTKFENSKLRTPESSGSLSRTTASESISRRDILKSLTMGVLAGSVLRVIPAQAAEYAHHLVQAEKTSAGGAYAPKFFSPQQYKTLQALCQTIIPPDDQLGGGLMWLDSTCNDRYGQNYLECAAEQQKQMLDLIAYRKNAKADASISQGVEFFSFLRNLTADGYFTSAIGIK